MVSTKALAVVLALGAVLATVSAECPNACSGHGECQTFRDFCKCYKGFQGNDCSQRTCAYGLSFIDTPNGDLDHDNSLGSGYGNRLADNWNRPTGTGNLTALNPMYRPQGWWERHPSQLYGIASDNAVLPMRQRQDEGHFYAECSNRGLCDRETGVCQCFTGYSGTACNRTACPNDCSGHGICESIREMVPGSQSDVTDYMLWDADKTYGCVCDPEYFGNDCSKRRCYRNDDPLTSVTTTIWKSEKLAEAGEVQIIKVACGNQGQVQTGSSITVTYTDVQFGEQYTTAAHTITGWGSDALAAADMKSKLEALPNQILASHADAIKIDSVTRDSQTTPFGGTVYRYFVTFNSRLGNVPTLSVDDTGLTCGAGIVLPSNYKSDQWNEMIGVTLVGAGPSEDTTVQLKLTANNTDSTGHATVGNVWNFAYKIFSGAETSASSAWSGATPFPDDASTAVPLVRLTTADTKSSLGDNLLKAKFTFPAGPELSDIDVDGSWSSYRTVSPPTQNNADETYEIQFKAPSKAVSVFTKLYESSETLPIAYQVKSRGTSAAEWMYVEYTSPFQTHWTSENFTISQHTPTTYNWSASWSGNSAVNQAFPSSWATLGSAVGVDKYLIFRFEHGDNTANGRNYDDDDRTWTVAAFPGHVSSSGGDADELLFVSWAAAARPVERLEYYIRVTNPGSSNSNVTRYEWSLNGVNMGEYAATANRARLGGVDASDDAGAIAIRFMHGVQDDDRVGRDWYFATVKTPVQATWSYMETMRVHYRGATSGSQVVPTKNLAIVFNLVSTASNPDTYKWKLSDDEVWYGANNGAGSAFGEDPFQLADAASHITESVELQKYVFWFSGGVDATGTGDDPARSCGDSVNSRYYVQMGSEGINDFGYCSDRGVCDEDTGECKCFKGYAGQDCHEQHALAL